MSADTSRTTRLVFKSNGKYLSGAPTWWTPAGRWTKDLNAALAFEGVRYEDSENIYVDFTDFMGSTRAETLLRYFRKRYPPAMVPSVILLQDRAEERDLKGSLSVGFAK